MMSASKALLQYVLQGQNEPEKPIEESAAHTDPYDPKILQLKLKKRYQLGMIKKMMQQAGYDDLARMTTLSRKNYDIDE